MDKIKQLTMEELIAIAYESRCAFCMCEIDDNDNNYWVCYADCPRRTCDDCRTFEGLTEEEAEEMDEQGYICECCRKDEKEADKSK